MTFMAILVAAFLLAGFPMAGRQAGRKRRGKGLIGTIRPTNRMENNKNLSKRWSLTEDRRIAPRATAGGHAFGMVVKVEQKHLR